MPQSKRQKAIIIDIKGRMGANQSSIDRWKKTKTLLQGKNLSPRIANDIIDKLETRRNFLLKKLRLAKLGEPIFKKDLTASAQHLE